MPDDVDGFVDGLPYRGRCLKCDAATESTVGAIERTRAVVCPNGHALAIDESFDRAAAQYRAEFRRLAS